MRLSVLKQQTMRRFVPAVGVSALGDGMSMVAVAWLALQISPVSQRGIWTALAVAAFSLPATIGALVFKRLVQKWPGARLVAADATLRAVVLGAIALLAAFHVLNPPAYVVLLGISGLLHAWGNAGVYTVVAEALPGEQHLTGNSLVSTVMQTAFIVGPAAAGAVIPLAGAGWVIGIDALSYLVLALIAWRLPARKKPEAVGTESKGIRYTGVIAVTMAFFFLYGPVEVALPIHVAQTGSAAVLGLYWTVFGIGAACGALLAAGLNRYPLWTIIAAVIVGWGASLLPVGISGSTLLGMLGFAVGGLIYGPFTSVTTALIQRTSPPDQLSRVLAARSALTIPATSLGALAGGPAVGVFGAQETLLLSGVLTIALGLAVFTASRSRRGLAVPAPPG